jgi:hypothetical protein
VVQQLHAQSSLGIRDESFIVKNSSPKPFSADEFLIAFRTQNTNEIWARKVQKNYKIFVEAHLLIKVIVLGMADASGIALEILSGLERTQIDQLSSTIAAEQGFSTLANGFKSKDWPKGVKVGFCVKSTSFVSGSWDMRDMLEKWEELAKVGQRKKS